MVVVFSFLSHHHSPSHVLCCAEWNRPPLCRAEGGLRGNGAIVCCSLTAGGGVAGADVAVDIVVCRSVRLARAVWAVRGAWCVVHGGGGGGGSACMYCACVLQVDM